MQVTVLGKSPAWQDAGGACSGYLVQEGDFTLLLDCGNGVFSRLREHVDYAAVDAVLITHLHADHFFDVVPYAFALGYGVRDAPARPALYGPPGLRECVRAIGGCLGDESLVESAFAVAEYDPVAGLSLGPLRVTLCEVPHYVLTHAVRIAEPGGASFTFGADCRPNPQLAPFAAGSELMLVEATLTAPETTGTRGHLTAREAGEHGRAARPGRLVLTHFSDELDRARIQAEGSAGYGAEVELAAPGAVFTI
jgi:ribonuclease BN (tRNA processing enzyme)